MINTGDVLMGYIDYLGWAVIQSFVYTDENNVKLDNEMNIMKADLENHKSTWHNITGTNKYQFDELSRNYNDELYVLNLPGGRFMKYNYSYEKNHILKNDYTLLHQTFELNTKIFSQYLFQESYITYEYVSSSCNVLENHDGVREK